MSLFLDFVDKLRRFGLENYHRYYSFYPGIVVDNHDPDQRGRIKVSLPTLLGGRTHAAWVEPRGVDMAGAGHGVFFPPYIGDHVDIYFESGDFEYPVYKGNYYALSELPSDFAQDYPHVKGFVLKSGQKILMNETKNQILISNSNTSSILIDANTNTVTVTTQTEMNVSTQKVLLGNSPDFSAAIGENIVDYNDNTLIVMTALGPSSTPITKMQSFVGTNKSPYTTYVKIQKPV